MSVLSNLAAKRKKEEQETTEVPRLIPSFGGVGTGAAPGSMPGSETFFESGPGAFATGFTGGAAIPIVSQFAKDPQSPSRGLARYRQENPVSSTVAETVGAVSNPLMRALPTGLPIVGAELASYEAMTNPGVYDPESGGVSKAVEVAKEMLPYAIPARLLGAGVEGAVDAAARGAQYVLDKFKPTGQAITDKAVREIASTAEDAGVPITELPIGSRAMIDPPTLDPQRRVGGEPPTDGVPRVGEPEVESAAVPMVQALSTRGNIPQSVADNVQDRITPEAQSTLMRQAQQNLQTPGPAIGVRSFPLSSRDAKTVIRNQRTDASKKYMPLYIDNPRIRNETLQNWQRDIATAPDNKLYTNLHDQIGQDVQAQLRNLRMQRGQLQKDISKGTKDGADATELDTINAEIGLLDDITKRWQAEEYTQSPLLMKTGDNAMSLLEWDILLRKMGELGAAKKDTPEAQLLFKEKNNLMRVLDNEIPDFRNLRNEYRMAQDSQTLFEFGQNMFKTGTRLDEVEALLANNADNPNAIKMVQSGVADAIKQQIDRGKGLTPDIKALLVPDNKAHVLLKSTMGEDQFNFMLRPIREAVENVKTAQSLGLDGPPRAKPLTGEQLKKSQQFINNMAKDTGFLIFGRGDLAAAGALKGIAEVLRTKEPDPDIKNRMLEILTTPAEEQPEVVEQIGRYLQNQGLSIQDLITYMGLENVAAQIGQSAVFRGGMFRDE